MRILFALFIVIPVLEMWLLIKVGSQIGAAPTIGLVLLTAMIGVALLKQQGISTLTRANRRMAAGELPAQEMAEGIFLAVGGALLLTPGFVTDAVGFVCLIPGLRSLLLGRLVKRFQNMQFQHINTGHGVYQSPMESGNRTIEGEYRRDD